MAAFTWFRSAESSLSVAGNTPENWLSTIYNAFVANSASPEAKWEVASYSSVSPKYLTLKRKSGVAGRIFLFGQNGSDPSGSAIMHTSPGASHLWISYAPTATVDTPVNSWLSGSPFTEDTYIKGLVAAPPAAYSGVFCYYDSDAGVVFHGYPGTSTGSFFAPFAGDLFVDTEGVNRPVVHAPGSYAWPVSNWPYQTLASFGSYINTTYGGNGPDTSYYVHTVVQGINPVGQLSYIYRLHVPTVSGGFYMGYPANYKQQFMPIWMHGNTSAQPAGLAGHFRQLGWGPEAYRREAPIAIGESTPYAYALAGSNQGKMSPIWLTNFEI